MSSGKKVDNYYGSFFKGCLKASYLPYYCLYTPPDDNDPYMDDDMGGQLGNILTVWLTIIPVLPALTAATAGLAIVVAIIGALTYPFIRAGALISDLCSPEQEPAVSPT